MARNTTRPVDVARRAAEERRKARGRTVERAQETRHDIWRRETFTLPRETAREKAREFFVRFPKAAYMTAVEAGASSPTAGSNSPCDDCPARIEFGRRRTDDEGQIVRA
jgi:hypothetical protein